jgi:putative nucleotidyltransferase with HDIG domain
VGAQIKGLQWESATALRIGRLDSLDIVLSHATVNRKHAEIVHTPQGWIVRDLSTDGTFVNGEQVGSATRKLQLHDVIRCGIMSFLVAVLEQGVAESCSPAADGYVKTTGSFVKVQATTQRTWEQALEVASAVEQGGGSQQGRHFLTLLRAGHHMSRLASLEDMLRNILNDTVNVLAAQRGSIVLWDSDKGELVLRCVSTARSQARAGRCFSDTLARRCFLQGESLLCADATADRDLETAQSVRHGSMASIICAVLRSPRQRLGVLHLDRGPFQEPFTQDDLDLADAIAANVAVGIESAQLVEKQRELFLQTVGALARAVEMRDEYTGNHTQRVATYSQMLAEELKLPPDDLTKIRVGTPLHDIGKIAVNDAVLRKPGKLTPEEFEHMKLHTINGAKILERVPDLAPMIPIIRNHHERWDGKGYPDGLHGENISMLARVVAVADAFDAMTSDRPYRQALSTERAFQELREKMGTHFDPLCVQAFFRIRAKIEALRAQEASPQPYLFESLAATVLQQNAQIPRRDALVLPVAAHP